MATLRKRDGKWEVQIRRAGFPQLTQTFNSRSAALAWASQNEAEMGNGTYLDKSQLNTISLADLIGKYRHCVTPTKKGHHSESARLKALLKDPIAEYRLSNLTPAIMANWRDKRLSEVTGSTVNRDLNLMSHIFNVAKKEWAVPYDNPVAQIRRPKENRGRKRRLTLAEEAKLLKELEQTLRRPDGTFEPGGTHNPWLQPIVIIALETAMRRGEILSMRWRDVHLDQAYLSLRDTKNGDHRDVPLSRRALDTLTRLPKEDDRVFPITEDAVKKGFQRAVERAAIRDLHFHDLRHEATSRLADRLDNVLELSAVTGHRTLSMLQRYYHPRASDLAKKLG